MTYSLVYIYYILFLICFAGISGNVVDNSGQPLRNAQLSVVSGHGHYEQGKISKNSGRFVQMMSEGYHKINVSLRGYDTEMRTVYVPKGSLKNVKIVLSKSSYNIDDNKAGSSSPLSSFLNGGQDYFYYPRKEFQSIKQLHPRNFDVNR